MKIQQYTLIDGAGNVEEIMELITKMQTVSLISLLLKQDSVLKH
jgi:hypothetical protein